MIAALKAIPAIVAMVNHFFDLWFSVTDAKISNDHKDKLLEFDAVMGAIKNAKNDNERILLARTLNRIRSM
jgi:hypothetical protein